MLLCIRAAVLAPRASQARSNVRGKFHLPSSVRPRDCPLLQSYIGSTDGFLLCCWLSGEGCSCGLWLAQACRHLGLLRLATLRLA